MTPLVREMATLVPEPETAHWFDLGTVPSHIPAGRTAWDDIRHMPYPRTVAVFVSDKGARYACWIAAGQHSVTIAYMMAEPGGLARYSPAMTITETDSGLRYTTTDPHASDAGRKNTMLVLAAIVQRLHQQHTAYRPQPQGTPAQQRKRAAKGKKPLFAWHTVTISATPKVAVATPDVAGTHASPRTPAHARTTGAGTGAPTPAANAAGSSTAASAMQPMGWFSRITESGARHEPPRPPAQGQARAMEGASNA